ncbi:MAG: MGMT family protein [archaeon]
MTTVFEEKVYSALKKIPKGKVSTYSLVARAISVNSPRAVGSALAKNPYAPVVPCHRVVKSDGTVGGFNGKKKGNEIERKKAILGKPGKSSDSL